MTDDLFRVGVVAGTHGLKGELKVYPTSEDMDRYSYLKDALLGDDEGRNPLIPVTVERVRFFKQFVIIKFKEFSDINEVEKFKGLDLFVTRENAIPLNEGEHYVKDLIGLPVIDNDTKETLGTLLDVMETGANDVYVVKREGKPDLLIPVIDDCVVEVSPENNRILVHLLPGLLELNS